MLYISYLRSFFWNSKRYTVLGSPYSNVSQDDQANTISVHSQYSQKPYSLGHAANLLTKPYTLNEQSL